MQIAGRDPASLPESGHRGMALPGVVLPGIRLPGAARRALALAAAVLALAACEPMFQMPETATAAPPARPAAAAAVAGPSPRSEAVSRFFTNQENSLRARGLMRTDPGDDIPLTAARLAENFEGIALFDEYVEVAGRLVARPTPSALRRWQTPVRMGVRFGEAVPAEQRSADMARIRPFAARLARLTGHPISVTDTATANFHVLIVTEDERRALAPMLEEIVPGIDELSLRTITDMPLSASCLVLAFAGSGTSVYTRAVAVIRAELPDLTRLSCIHEELAQGLGLPNDTNARPSIFNDAQEFALLTPHDELLLRILYDRRLRPGMTAVQARPIVEQIAFELLGGES